MNQGGFKIKRNMIIIPPKFKIQEGNNDDVEFNRLESIEKINE